MKRLFYYTTIILFLSQLLACSKDNLEVFNLREGAPAQVIAEGGGNDLIKTNDYVQVPMKVKLSSPASKTFDVEIQLNTDTVNKLIQSGTLKEVVTLPNSAFSFPNIVKFQYGADTTSFLLTISRTEIERVYGKKFALSYKLSNPGKGNQLGNPSSIIVTMDSKNLLTATDIHYLSITNSPGNIILASDHNNYNTTPSGIEIPIGVSLASFPSKFFYVEVRGTTDSISNWITQKKVPANTIGLQENEYALPSRVQVLGNKSAAAFNISIPWDVITKNKDKFLAVTVYLKDPTLHVINPLKNYTTILIDCANVVEFDVTGEATLSVNRDNNGGASAGEGSLKFVDDLTSTKFLQSAFTGDLQCTLTFTRTLKIGAYTLTSGNDAIERDPKSWFLEGSLDGKNWVTIDTRTNESFPNRIQTRRFNVQKPGIYKFYRLNITENVGSSLFQCSEWRMIEFL
ncbi:MULTISPECIES: discoidin domain-containing protein [unclassified Sphingobacterium]|uniref:discoidin domain-containing protein n=1 Tax=unclassified Sphingobacterium TaxID=2609468 RepID=UPI0025E94F96|nr:MULTISPECIES: discoidin domain-containing protein [unclassified Sphingobacterium]